MKSAICVCTLPTTIDIIGDKYYHCLDIRFYRTLKKPHNMKKVTINLAQLIPKPGGGTWHLVKFKDACSQALIMIDPTNLNIAIIGSGPKTGDWVGVSSLLYFKSVSRQNAKKILEKEIKDIEGALPALVGIEKGSVQDVLKKMEKIYKENFS